jgi:hypothetical protein
MHLDPAIGQEIFKIQGFCAQKAPILLIYRRLTALDEHAVGPDT